MNRSRVALLVLAGSGVLATCPQTLLADGTVYFTGAIGIYAGGTNTYKEDYYRTDPGGQASRTFIQPSEPTDPTIPYLVMRSTASAGLRYLVASTFAQNIKIGAGSGNFNYRVEGTAAASFTVDDLVLHGPGPTIFTSARARLTGRISVGTSVNYSGYCSVQASISLAGFNNANGGFYSENTNGGNHFINGSGPLQNFNGLVEFGTIPKNLPTETPLTMTMTLSVGSSIEHYFAFSGNGSSNADFGSTLQLVVGKPVFDLPPGYTASSVQANIVDNIYIPTCRADFNHDSLVDDTDFTVFVGGYNILACADPEMYPGCPADVNYDGFVDDADFVVFVVAYNELACP